MNIKKFNNFRNDSLDEGLFDYFRPFYTAHGWRKKRFSEEVKKISNSFKKEGINPKFESSRDVSNWTWSDSVYGTRLNLQIELRVNKGRFICDVPDYPNLSFKNDFGKKVMAGGLHHVVESLFKINYPSTEIKEVFNSLTDNFDIEFTTYLTFHSYGNDFKPSDMRCVWEINFDMLTDLYESSEFEKEFDIIETQLKNMGWSLYLWGKHYEEGEYDSDYNPLNGLEWEEEEEIYEEPEEEEEKNENFNPQDSVYLKYYCYPTEYSIGDV
jgi:hypothetical protein